MKQELDREDLRSYSRNGRFYVLPDGGDGNKFPSVTSIISGGVPKPALMGWAGKYAATTAVENHDLVGQMIEEDGKAGAIDWVKSASRRYTQHAGMEGTAVHDFAEALLLGEDPDPEDLPTERAIAMAHQVENFMQSVKPTLLHTEALLYSKEYEYAGAADLIVKIKNEKLKHLFGWEPVRTKNGKIKRKHPVVLFDFKTSKSGVYGETALQLSAYTHADTLLTLDGEEHRPPRIDIGAVIHIRENSWAIVPVDISERTFQAFLAAKAVAEWRWNHERNAVGNIVARGK